MALPKAQLIVITDDSELEQLANDLGVEVILETRSDGIRTLDEVIYSALPELFKKALRTMTT